MKENQENQTSLQISEPQARNQQLAVNSLQGQMCEIDINNLGATVDDIENAAIVPIKANIEAWKPKEGDNIRGVFLEIIEVMMPPVGDKTGEKRPVPVVVFFVPKRIIDKKTGEELKTVERISILGARAVNHFSNVTPQTLWCVEFEGQKLVNGKPNNIYNFYPITMQK